MNSRSRKRFRPQSRVAQIAFQKSAKSRKVLSFEHMAAESESDVQLTIGHVLFMDVVSYSKLLLDEQREIQQQLGEIDPAKVLSHRENQ